MIKDINTICSEIENNQLQEKYHKGKLNRELYFYEYVLDEPTPIVVYWKDYSKSLLEKYINKIQENPNITKFCISNFYIDWVVDVYIQE